jgi:hypothetical protein
MFSNLNTLAMNSFFGLNFNFFFLTISELFRDFEI